MQRFEWIYVALLAAAFLLAIAWRFGLMIGL
jgi:hypothetical protein